MNGAVTIAEYDNSMILFTDDTVTQLPTGSKIETSPGGAGLTLWIDGVAMSFSRAALKPNVMQVIRTVQARLEKMGLGPKLKKPPESDAPKVVLGPNEPEVKYGASYDNIEE